MSKKNHRNINKPSNGNVNENENTLKDNESENENGRTTGESEGAQGESTGHVEFEDLDFSEAFERQKSGDDGIESDANVSEETEDADAESGEASELEEVIVNGKEYSFNEEALKRMCDTDETSENDDEASAESEENNGTSETPDETSEDETSENEDITPEEPGDDIKSDDKEHKEESTDDEEQPRKRSIFDSIPVAILTFILGVGLTAGVFTVLHGLGTVGSVNGIDVSKAEINDYLKTRMNSIVLNYMNDRIQIDALAELGVTVPESEVDAEFEEVCKDNGGLEAFTEQLELGGSSVEAYKLGILKTKLQEKGLKYFTDKQLISEHDIDVEYKQRMEDGNELALINIESVAVDDEGNPVEGAEVNKSENLQYNVAFDEVPEVGDTTESTDGATRVKITVTEVNRGIDNEKVREYISELLKTTSGTEEYQDYINDKIANAVLLMK